MKYSKILIATGVAVLAVASIAAAATFNTNLTVGSTGADVSALQNTLLEAGYSIPSISAGTADTGYFGSQTKAAVMAYQSQNNIPNTGFVGPLTRASLNAGVTAAGAPSTATCPLGYTCVANTVTPVCPIGYTCVANTATGTGTVIGGVTGITAGTDGSALVSQSSFVSTGATIKKGETKNVVAVKLQATAGSVAVTRVDAHFSVRPWLFFSQVKLIDSTGQVLATKILNSINDVTEVNVGSDYLVRFEGLNYIVNPGTNPDLAVSVSVLASTDRIAVGGTSVIVNIPTGAIRTINGIGISDSIGGVATGNTTGVGAATFTLSSTGSVADISTKVSSAAPATQATVPVSATAVTNNVMLGLFSLKSANNASTINAISFQTNPAASAAAQTGIFSNVRIVIGSTSYGAASYTATGLATFSSLNIPLTQDIWTDVKLVADVAATSTDVSVSSTLLASTIVAIDNTYTTATISGSNQTSVITLLTINSVSLSLSATPGVVTQELKGIANSSLTTSAAVAYTFTLTNNSSNNLYVSSAVGTFINGTTTSPANNASSTISAIEPIAAVAGDGTGYYVLQSGSSRTFTVSGMIQSPGGPAASQRLSITSIQYGNTTAGTGSSITAGLTTLTASIILTPVP